MSLFPQLFAAAFAAQASFMADPGATYLAFGSAPGTAWTPITAIAGPESAPIVDGEQGRVEHHACPITVRQSDVAAPVRGDQVKLASGVIWTVDHVESGAGGVWILHTVRPVTTEATRHYRNR